MKFKNNRKVWLRSGFTFIELFLVLLIAGIFFAVSVPQFRSHYDNVRIVSFSRELKDFINYLSQRSVVERAIYSLYLDLDTKQYYAQVNGATTKSYSIPDNLEIEVNPADTGINFYPNGTIDPVVIKIRNKSARVIVLSTKGVFGGVKIQEFE